jgi:acyl dehydratase
VSPDPRELVGARRGPTAWRTVSQEQIDAFAQLTGDRQWIHVDVPRARRESPFGTTIAHGNLTLSLIDGFRDELMPAGESEYAYGVNYGYARVRFPEPVPAGARVRGTLEIVEVEARPAGWWQMLQRFTVELEDADKPACVADSLVWVRPAQPAPDS